MSRAYLIRLPLDCQGMVDAEALRRNPRWAKVRRYWSSEADESGDLVEMRGDWELIFGGKRRLLKLDGQAFQVGGRATIVETDGTILNLKIADVR